MRVIGLGVVATSHRPVSESSAAAITAAPTNRLVRFSRDIAFIVNLSLVSVGRVHRFDAVLVVRAEGPLYLSAGENLMHGISLTGRVSKLHEVTPLMERPRLHVQLKGVAREWHLAPIEVVSA